MLTLTASSVATPGSYAVTISGVSGTLSASTAISLTVTPPPSFALTASPTSVTVAQGASVTDTITVVPQNGFTGNVTLSASGLPTGVTAAFTPTGSEGLYTATFTVAPTAAKGSATVTITGTSGALTHKTTFTLNVLATATGTAVVNLATVANISGAAIDTVPFTGGGLDNGGRSYSGMLMGASQNIGGIVYSLAPMTGLSAVSGS